MRQDFHLIPTVFPTFFYFDIFKQVHQDVECRLEPVRTWGDLEPIICVEKLERVWTSLPNPSGPATFPTTTVSQYIITVSTTILNMVGGSVSPCVTPQVPMKGSPWYFPVQATILSLS